MLTYNVTSVIMIGKQSRGNLHVLTRAGSILYRKGREGLQNGHRAITRKGQRLYKEPDLLRIQEAYEFAEQAHHGQVRKSGEPYILHPLAVADIVVNMQMDTLSIICVAS